MSQKQFPPSARRLEKLRRQGKVIKSPWVSVCVGFWSLLFSLPLTLSWVRDRTLIQWLSWEVWAPGAAFRAALVTGWRAVATMLATVALGALAAEVAQGRGLFLPSLLLQGFHRYRPAAFVSRIKHGLLDAAAGLARCAVLFLVVAPMFMGFAAQSGSVMALQGGQAERVLAGFVASVAVRAGVVLACVAAFGYGVARWRYLRQNRMSLHELREEHREAEGDPHLKSARKHEHMALVMSELERRVRRSKVVVVRPARPPSRAVR